MAGEVNRANPCRLLDNRLRQLSGQIRKVEDPVVIKQKSAKVRLTASLLYVLSAYEENIPIFHLEVDFSASSWVPLYHSESITIHSYSEAQTLYSIHVSPHADVRLTQFIRPKRPPLDRTGSICRGPI